jgi:hypothetical protein
MKYYVIYVANGNLAINNITEFTSLEDAKAKFHDVCKLMWSDASVESAFVAILDNQLDTVGGYKEAVIKAQPEPEEA